MSFLKSIIARVGLDGTEFDHGARQIEHRAEKMGENVVEGFKEKLAEGFAVYLGLEGARNTMEFAHQMEILSTRTGISTDDLQKFDFAAKRSGTSIDSVVTAVEKLGIAQAKAINDPKIYEALTRLGLSPDQIHNLEGASENFQVIGERIKTASVNGQVLKDMTEAFGRSSRELIPMFKNGLGEAGDELKRINGLIPEDKIKRMAEASERMEEAWISIRSILGDIVPVVVDMIGDMMKFVKLSYIALSVGDPKKMTPAQRNFVDHVQFDFFDPYNLKGTDHEPKKAERIPYNPEPDTKTEKAEQRIANDRKRKEEEIQRIRRDSYLDSLSKEERLQFLRSEREELGGVIKANKNDPDTILESKIQQAKDDAGIERLERELGKTRGRREHEHRPDSLARIGGFIGGSAEGALVDVARSQLAVQRQIAKNTSKPAHVAHSMRDA